MTLHSTLTFVPLIKNAMKTKLECKSCFSTDELKEFVTNEKIERVDILSINSLIHQGQLIYQIFFWVEE